MNEAEERVPGKYLKEVFGEGVIAELGAKPPPPLGCFRFHPPDTPCNPQCVWGVGAAVFPGKQRTLAIFKPNAVARGAETAITHRVRERFTVLRAGRMTMTRAAAADFYAEHQGKPFFEGLVAFMASGEMVLLVLEGVSAIERWRAMLGPTDPRLADPWTIRGEFGNKDGVVWENAAHGSSSPAAAAREIAFFRGDEWIAQRGDRWSPRKGVWVANHYPVLGAILVDRPTPPAFDVIGAVGRLNHLFAQREHLAQQAAVEVAVARGIRTRHELELVLAALGLAEGGPAWAQIIEGEPREIGQ
jgi:nucleoside-diphosphate kinase